MLEVFIFKVPTSGDATAFMRSLMGFDPGGVDGPALGCASRALPSVIVLEYPIPELLSSLFVEGA